MIIIEDDIELESPEEALFYGLCCFHEVPVERASRSLAIAVAEHPGTWWQPGFRVAVPRLLDTWVEVADGQRESQFRLPRNVWRKSLGHPLAVLYREDLDFLRDADRPAQFVARLKQAAARRP